MNAKNDNGKPSPLAETLAAVIDQSIGRRLRPFERVIGDTNDKIDALQKEVDQVKDRPTQDPVAILTEALGQAQRILSRLDDQAAAQHAADLGTAK